MTLPTCSSLKTKKASTQRNGKSELTGHAFIVLALGEADDATAPSSVFVRFAIGIGSAGHIVAWIDAASLDAGQVVLAVVVGRAFLLGLGTSGAASAVRIAGHTPRAFAYVTTFGVEAVGTPTAGVVRAFVYVDAAVLWIALVTRQTHTSRWV